MQTQTESIGNKRKRLIFRSWHRGTREMDLILGSFAERYVPDFSEEELTLFDEMLNHSDPDLYNWVTHQEEPPAQYRDSVMEKFLQHQYKH